MISIRSLTIVSSFAVLQMLVSYSDAFWIVPTVVSSSSSLSSSVRVAPFTTITTSATSTTTQLQIFGDALKGAFANDDSLGAVKNAGLKNGPNENDKVTINGQKVKAIVGQKVSVVAASARVKISYSCKAGDCGTCNIKMNGKTVKACQMTIPSGKCDIKTL